MDPFEDLERGLATDMDVETFRNTVIDHIWRNDMEGLRRICKRQITLAFFLEKVIAEIALGNRWNDVLHLMARRLIEADPSLGGYAELLDKKRPLVRNPAGGREVLKPFVREELASEEYAEKLRLIADSHAFLGLDALVAANAGNTSHFIRQCLAEHSNAMDPETRLFQLLCEMAVAYRNHHHRSDLVELLERAGGRLSLFKSGTNIGSVRIFEGTDAIHELEAEARRARGLLTAGDHAGAQEIYEKLLPKMDTLFASTIPMVGAEYPNALLFSGVLLALNGDTKEAQERFMKCMAKRYRFGDLLMLNVNALRDNAPVVRGALAQVPADEPSHLAFEKFFELASGHNYAEANRLYDRFLVAAGDRDMDEAVALSEQLLGLYEEKRNLLVPHSLCEFMVRMFRACHFALQGDVVRAEREYVEASQGEVPTEVLRHNFSKIAADPEKTLSHYFGD